MIVVQGWDVECLHIKEGLEEAEVHLHMVAVWVVAAWEAVAVVVGPMEVDLHVATGNVTGRLLPDTMIEAMVQVEDGIASARDLAVLIVAIRVAGEDTSLASPLCQPASL